MLAPPSKHMGFTLLELIIGMAIIGVVSTISVSAYSGYIETSKTSQAVIQIRALSFLIDDYALEYGEYPNSLRDIGNENLTDPWGNPYAYLNLHSSNRENHDSDDSENDDDEHGESDEENDSSDSDGYSSRDSHGESDEHSERNEHAEHAEHAERDDDDDDDDRSDHGSSDRHGEREQRQERNRINIGSARKDGNLVPINTNYDLCSHGKDGKTKASLRAKDSHDDIIYANDGSYIGLAEEF